MQLGISVKHLLLFSLISIFLVTSCKKSDDLNRLEDSRLDDPFREVMCRDTFFADAIFAKDRWITIEWETELLDEDDKKSAWSKSFSINLTQDEFDNKYPILSEKRHEWVSDVYQKHDISITTIIKAEMNENGTYTMNIGLTHD